MTPSLCAAHLHTSLRVIEPGLGDRRKSDTLEKMRSDRWLVARTALPARPTRPGAIVGKGGVFELAQSFDGRC
jgi:hypothetical protein